MNKLLLIDWWLYAKVKVLYVHALWVCKQQFDISFNIKDQILILILGSGSTDNRIKLRPNLSAMIFKMYI